jgi:hypothetical protein
MPEVRAPPTGPSSDPGPEIAAPEQPLVPVVAHQQDASPDESPWVSPWTDASEEKAAAASAKTIKRLAKEQERLRGKSWDNWMAEAMEYNRIATSAERISGSNGRMGRVYSDMMNHLLSKNDLTGIHTSQMRSALLQIAENRSAVEEMRKGWDADELSRWASPLTVWDKFRKRQKADDPRKGKAASKAPKIGKSTQDVIDDMQAEIDRLTGHVKKLQELLRQPFDGLDSAEIADLVIEQTDDDRRRGVIERLGNWEIASGTPAGLGSRLQADDSWPVTALRDDADREADSP